MPIPQKRTRHCHAILSFSFAAIFAIAGFSGRAFAQNGPAGQGPLKQLTLEQLGDVEVTSASKEPAQVWKTPAAIYVITQEDIRRSGVTTIADALRLAPGVEVGQLSSTTWAVGIRGLQSNFSKTVLVLIDGRSVYTPLFAGVYWDVQDLPLENIDRIEVIRGPGGTIWGANAVNGVINIVTKNSSETHGVLASVAAGNDPQTVDVLQYGGGNGAGFNYRVYGKGFVRPPEHHLDQDDYDGWSQQRGGMRLDWDRGRDKYMVEGDIYSGDSPHRIGTTDVDDSVSGGNLVAQWRRQLSNDSDLYLETYFDRTIRIGEQLGETRNTIDIDLLYHVKVAERHDLTFGGGLRWSPNHFIQRSPGIDLVPHDETDQIYSGFLQDEILLVNDRLSLTLGAKLEHNNFSGFDVQPSARILWTPTPHASFWAAVTRAVATPSRIEEDFQLSAELSATPPVVLLVAGNPHFKSESLLGYEGGYRQLLTSRLYLDLAVFHNNYNDLQSFGAPITTSETDPPPPHTLITIPYQNTIAGTTNGFEVAPSYQATKWWRLTGSYSFVAVDVHANGPTSDISSTGSVRTYEGSTPRHEIELQSNFNLPKKFEFDQVYRYASALPAQAVSAYQTVDLRLGWHLGSHLEFSFVGQNLLQPFHAEWGTGDPSQVPIAIRRSAYGKVTWRQKAR
jgi:iron complex outermembrane recepter protein